MNSTRSMKGKVTVLFTALSLVLPLVALVPFSAAASSPQGSILLSKTCDPNFPTVPTCTVISSSSGPIPVGTVATYSGIFSPRLTANVVLSTPDGSTATGFVTLNYASGLGTVTFVAGTGDLAGFHAIIAVNCGPGCSGVPASSGITIWAGTYIFTSS
jgi:hypothetical protein